MSTSKAFGLLTLLKIVPTGWRPGGSDHHYQIISREAKLRLTLTLALSPLRRQWF